MLKNHPKGLMTLFFTEMWERFGFYTMLAVFVLYMDEVLGWSDVYKGQVYGFFLAFVYFTPILGGWIADQFLGYRRTIIIGAITLGVGYALLALSGPDAIWLFYFALVIMVLGNGLFKANISVLVGNLYEPGSAYKDVGYNIFYMGINLGAFIAPLAATALHDLLGTYNAAFAAAAVGMLLSLIVFEIWKSNYIYADNKNEAGKEHQGKQEAEKLEPGQERERIIALGIVFAIVIFFWMSFHQNGLTMTLFAQRSTIDENLITETNIKDWPGFKKSVLNDSIPLSDKLAQINPDDELSEEELNALNKFLLEPELFSINGKRVQKLPYEDTPNDKITKQISVIGLFNVTVQDEKKIDRKKLASELDKILASNPKNLTDKEKRQFREVNRKLMAVRYPQIDKGSYPLNPETYATFNPLFILLLTPLVVALFNLLRKRGKEPSSPGKIGIGMFITGLSFIILVVASLKSGNSDANNMGPSWLISTYFVVTIGELFLSPMGLSFVSKVAPARMRGLMMGGWFGATAVGNYLAGAVGGFYDSIPHHVFFALLVIISFIAAIAVLLFLKKLKHATRGT